MSCLLRVLLFVCKTVLIHFLFTNLCFFFFFTIRWCINKHKVCWKILKFVPQISITTPIWFHLINKLNKIIGGQHQRVSSKDIWTWYSFQITNYTIKFNKVNLSPVQEVVDFAGATTCKKTILGIYFLFSILSLRYILSQNTRYIFVSLSLSPTL